MNDAQRDYVQFPEDENGDVLWHMKTRGDSLVAPREIDFTAIFASEDTAVNFAVDYLRSGMKVEMSEDEPNEKDDLNWRVTIYVTAIPTHSDISHIETLVRSHAERLGGIPDGWSSIFIPG